MYYEELCAANAVAFLESPEYTKKKDCWKLLYKTLSQHNIPFALCCSAGMYFFGIIDEYHDYDIVIRPENIDEVDELLSQIGTRVPKENNKTYFDDAYFGTFCIGGIEIDVMSEFTIITYCTRYRYSFKVEDIVRLRISKEMEIPVVPLEVQYLLYAMMSGWQAQRKFKKGLLFRYLMERDITHAEIFEEALNLDPPLPYWVKKDIGRMMNNR